MRYVDSDRCADLLALAARRREAVADGRDWLLDCFVDEADDIRQANAARIVQGVQYHYAGGWQQFLADSLNERSAS